MTVVGALVSADPQIELPLWLVRIFKVNLYAVDIDNSLCSIQILISKATHSFHIALEVLKGIAAAQINSIDWICSHAKNIDMTIWSSILVKAYTDVRRTIDIWIVYVKD